MPTSLCDFLKNASEFQERKTFSHVPDRVHGIYVLYDKSNGATNAVYVGMSSGPNTGVKRRLRMHDKSKRKGEKWTHFSIFQVWDNISLKQVKELEGLLRHVFRFENDFLNLNLQKRYQPLAHINKKSLKALKGI